MKIKHIQKRTYKCNIINYVHFEAHKSLVVYLYDYVSFRTLGISNGIIFFYARTLSKRPGSVWNCLWGHALKRYPGINHKSRVLYHGPGFDENIRQVKFQSGQAYIFIKCLTGK